MISGQLMKKSHLRRVRPWRDNYEERENDIWWHVIGGFLRTRLYGASILTYSSRL